MNRIRKQLSRISPLSICIILLFAATMSYFLFRVFAASGTATLYTSPGGTQSVTNGQSFTVNVRISTGGSVPVTGAAVYMSYPTDKLQVLGQSYGGSPYTTQLVASNSGGVLRMDRAAFPAIAGGDQLFAQVSFKAIATGSAAIGFTGSSIVTSGEDDSNILAQKNGVTYNISAPAAPAPSSGSGGSSSSGSSSSGTSSSGSSSTPRSSSGSSTSGGSTTSSGTAGAGTSSSGSTGDTGTAAGTTDSGAVGDDGQPVSQAISTIAITILDSKNQPVEGAEVTINGQTAKTDKNGVARFDNVPAGNQKIAVKYNGKTTDKVVQVKGAHTTASPELFKVAIVRNKFNPMVLALPLLVLVAAGIVLLRPWNRFVQDPVGNIVTDTDLGSAGPGQPESDGIVASGQPSTLPSSPASPPKETPGMVYTPGQQSDAPIPQAPSVPPSPTPEPPTSEPVTPPESTSPTTPTQPKPPADESDEAPTQSSK